MSDRNPLFRKRRKNNHLATKIIGALPHDVALKMLHERFLIFILEILAADEKLARGSKRLAVNDRKQLKIGIAFQEIGDGDRQFRELWDAKRRPYK